MWTSDVTLRVYRLACTRSLRGCPSLFGFFSLLPSQILMNSHVQQLPLLLQLSFPCFFLVLPNVLRSLYSLIFFSAPLIFFLLLLSLLFRRSASFSSFFLFRAKRFSSNSWRLFLSYPSLSRWSIRN